MYFDSNFSYGVTALRNNDETAMILLKGLYRK